MIRNKSHHKVTSTPQSTTKHTTHINNELITIHTKFG